MLYVIVGGVGEVADRKNSFITEFSVDLSRRVMAHYRRGIIFQLFPSKGDVFNDCLYAIGGFNLTEYWA